MQDTKKDSFFPESEEPEIKIPEFLQSSNVNSASINTLEAQVKTWGAGASKDKTCNDVNLVEFANSLHESDWEVMLDEAPQTYLFTALQRRYKKMEEILLKMKNVFSEV